MRSYHDGNVCCISKLRNVEMNQFELGLVLVAFFSRILAANSSSKNYSVCVYM